MLKESNQNFLIAFIVSFVYMYMILAAQFESFVHPITILLALPLTLPFALVSLILLRTPLDLFAMFGLFMLFGIVKKNGILQVDYTNVLRAKGLPREQAIIEANHTRLRPILMTTVMLIAAMIPIALGRGRRVRLPRKFGQSGLGRSNAFAALNAAGHARGLYDMGRRGPVLFKAFRPTKTAPRSRKEGRTRSQRTAR